MQPPLTTSSSNGATPPQLTRWQRIVRLYTEGFKSMTWGRTTWAIILIKLFIMFGILKVFFFPNFLSDKGATTEERTEYIHSEYQRRAVESPAPTDPQ